VGFVVDKAVLGQVFCKYFGFPCQAIHLLLLSNSGLGSTLPPKEKKKVSYGIFDSRNMNTVPFDASRTYCLVHVRTALAMPQISAIQFYNRFLS
jgi:hypothetical protein